MLKRKERGEIIVGVMFLIGMIIPAAVIVGNKQREKHQEWLLMEEKLKDRKTEKYYYKVVESWKLVKPNDIDPRKDD